MAKDNELVIKINGSLKGYKKALKAAAEETEDLQLVVNTIAKTGAIAFAGFGAAILFAAKSAGKFETIGVQFEVLTGSVEIAQQTIKELSDFAAKTPFNFPGIAKAGKQLLAFGITGKDLIPTLTNIGDVAAATGAPFTDLSLIFGQVRAATKLTGERLLQLEERAIPIGPALAKTMGVAESSIRDLVSKGEISFKTFEKAFASLSEKGGLAFQGMAKSSKTFEGQLSTLADNFDLVTAEIGKNFLPVLKQLTAAFINVLEFIRNNPGLTDFIAKMLVAGTVTGALLTTVGLGAIAFIKLRTAIVASAIATKGLSFAIKGLIGSTGIGLLIAFLPEIIQLFQDVFGASTDAVEGAAKEQKQILIQQAKDEKAILQAKLKGLTDQEISFLKRRQEITRRAKATVQNEDEEAAAQELETLELLHEILIKEEKEFAKNKRSISKKTFDKKTQDLINERVLLTSHLSGVEKEELGFLKRRLELQTKARDAEAIQDKTRKALALGNIKLLNQEIAKEEEDLAIKRQQITDDKAKKDAEIQAKEEDATNKRVLKLAAENEAIRANQDNLEKQEIDFLARRRELRDQEAEAVNIKNETERQLALENIALQNDTLLEEEIDFFTRRDELRAEQVELEAALNEELAQLSIEQRLALRDQELEELESSLQTKEVIRSKAAKKELLAKRKENELFAKDEQKFGEIIAKFKAFQRSDNLSNAQTAANALSQLQQSESKELAAIGKAAALVQIAIDTQRGALAAFTALSGIPIVGPALGAAAAAALIAFGAERAAKVQAAQGGALVGGTGFRDTQPFMLTPGELVVPRQNFEEVIQAVSIQRAANVETEEEGDLEAEGTREILIGLQPDAADFLTVEQNEQTFLGTSQAIV